MGCSQHACVSRAKPSKQIPKIFWGKFWQKILKKNLTKILRKNFLGKFWQKNLEKKFWEKILRKNFEENFDKKNWKKKLEKKFDKKISLSFKLAQKSSLWFISRKLLNNKPVFAGNFEVLLFACSCGLIWQSSSNNDNHWKHGNIQTFLSLVFFTNTSSKNQPCFLSMPSCYK